MGKHRLVRDRRGLGHRPLHIRARRLANVYARKRFKEGTIARAPDVTRHTVLARPQ